MNKQRATSLEETPAASFHRKDIAPQSSSIYGSKTTDEIGHFVKDTIPPPLSVSLEQIVNPTPVLLEQFPLPNVASFGGTPLPTITTSPNANHSGWSSSEVETFVQRLSVTMQDLAVEGQCSHLLQDSSHNVEEGRGDYRDNGMGINRSPSVGGADRRSSMEGKTIDAACSVLSVDEAGELAAASSIRAIREIASQMHSSTTIISRPTTLSAGAASSSSTPARRATPSHPQKGTTTSPWEKQESGMMLRGRNSHNLSTSQLTNTHAAVPPTLTTDHERSSTVSSSSHAELAKVPFENRNPCASTGTAIDASVDSDVAHDISDTKVSFIETTPTEKNNVSSTSELSDMSTIAITPPRGRRSGGGGRGRGRPSRAVKECKDSLAVDWKLSGDPNEVPARSTPGSSLSLLLSSSSHITAEKMWRSASQVALDAQPFMDVEMEKLMEFFHELRDSSENGGSGKEESESNYFAVCRGLLAATCLAHPARHPITWSPHTLPTVDQIMDDFSLLVRLVSSYSASYTLVKEKEGGRDSTAFTDSSPESSTKSIPTSFTVSRDQQAPHKYMVHLLELLRAYLNTTMHLILCPHVRLVSDANLQRMEDIVYRILFVTPLSFEKALYRLYSTYVVEMAVQAYGTIWNHMEDQRHRLREEFFSRLRIDAELLLERNCVVSSANVKVMPLTLSILSAIQSCPFFSQTAEEPDGAGPSPAPNLRCWLSDQCSVWVDTLMRELLFKRVTNIPASKLESGGNAPLLSQVFEDAAELVGAVEWPSADLFCRQCILALSRLFPKSTFSNSERRATDSHSDGTVLLPFAVDAVARFLKTFLSSAHATLPSLESSPAFSSAMGLRNCSIPLLEKAFPNGRTLPRTWCTAMMPKTIPESSCVASNIDDDDDDDEEGRRTVVSMVPREDLESREEEDEPSISGSAGIVRELESIVYLALRSVSLHTNGTTSHENSLASISIGSYMAPHTLAAYIAFWSWLDEPRKGSNPPSLKETKDLVFGEDAVEAVKATHLETSPSQIRQINVLVSAQSERGVFHESVRRLLVSLLISVIQPKQDASMGSAEKNNSMDANTVGALRRALSHLTEVVQLSPQLVEVVWPMLRKYIQTGSVRLRESGVPLLSTLLSVSLTTCTSAACPRLEVATNVLSVLLHLLDDESVSVTARAIAVLEGLLTNLSLSSILRKFGENHISFVQSKLLNCMEFRADRKTADDIVRIFTVRWIYTLAVEEDTAHTTAQTTLTRELLTLVELHAGSFPFEITKQHPVLRLLQRMWDSSGAAHSGENEKTSSPVRERRRSAVLVDSSAMKHTLQTLGRSLLSRYQAPVSRDDAVLCLATIHLLSMVSPQVVSGLTETLVQELKYPVETVSPAYGDGEMIGATYIQICSFLRQVLPERPAVSLDKVASLLTQLLSKYAGPHQQRVILTSCGALVGLITNGMPQTQENQNCCSDVYLCHCYSLMNGYYVRLQSLLPTLLAQPSHMAYAQRFLFLLSELLRLYRGWRDPIPALLQLKSTSQPEIPNRLALHKGICENVFTLVEEIEKKVPFASQPPPLAAMVLRVLGSLCILDANTFLYRCERRLSIALAAGADDRLHVQGLSMISDFLSEEEDRVEQSSLMKLPPGASALALPPTVVPEEENDEAEGINGDVTRSSGTKRSRQERTTKRKEEGRSSASRKRKLESGKLAIPAAEEVVQQPSITSTPAVPVWMEDQNSGMSPWIMAKFIDPVLRLVSHHSAAIRQLCVHILSLTAQGGLLPPMRYAYALLLMSADLSNVVRSSAQRSLAEHSGHWREDIKLSAVTKAAFESLDYHNKIRSGLASKNLLSAAYQMDGKEYHSIWEEGFQMLQRKDRPQFLSHILGIFFEVDSASTWCTQNPPSCWGTASSLIKTTATSSSTPYDGRHPLTYLSHIAIALSLLPIAAVPSDSKHFIQLCVTGIDLEGQSAFDAVDEMLQGNRLTSLTSTVLYHCFGVLLLSWMSRYMQSQVEAISKTVAMGKTFRSKRTTVGGKERHGSAAHFIQLVSAHVQKLFPLVQYCFWRAPGEENKSTEEDNVALVMDALKHLRSELSLVVSSAEHLAMTSVHPKRKLRASPKKKGCTKKPPRKRVRRSPSTIESTLESSYSCSSSSSSCSSSDNSSSSNSSSSESSSDSD